MKIEYFGDGAGKYDATCEAVHMALGADLVILVVMNGLKGNGLSVTGPLEMIAEVPDILRKVADNIEKLKK